MPDITKNIIQAYNLGYIETHHHSKALAYAIRAAAQSIHSTSDRPPTEEWSKGFVVGLSAAKQELVKLAEELENYSVVTEEE